MSIAAVPANADEALTIIESLMEYLADLDAASLPAEAIGEHLRAMERIDTVAAAAWGRLLAAFDAQGGPVGDGQRTTRAWLTHSLRVTRAQAARLLAVRAVATGHPVLWAGLRDRAVSSSVAVQLAKWTAPIPDEFRQQAEEILVAAAKAGAGLPELARICAEIRYQTAPPDPDDQNDQHLDRGVYLDTTIDGVGVIRGDLSADCAAMVQAVLDALSAPAAGGDLRTQPQRYHDALSEAMRRLLASNLLPQRAGQPVKALVHIGFADLIEMDKDSVLQDRWIAAYRQSWAGHRAAASAGPDDGGAWLEGDAARKIACDAMMIPVVLADIDPGAIEDLITACVQYHHIRARAASDQGSTSCPPGAADADGQAANAGGQTPADIAAAAARSAEVLAMLEHQILATVIQIVSGPGGLASFLRRHLLGKGLNGPSLPLDVGQTDDIPVHLRRLVALRDQGCQYPGGCHQPAAACQPHHVIHRADGGSTSLTNLKDLCHWHHHVTLHQLGWKLTVFPDGTSQVRSPTGKIIRSHSPPPGTG
jgi:Domain of unknown function (DUF222)